MHPEGQPCSLVYNEWNLTPVSTQFGQGLLIILSKLAAAFTQLFPTAPLEALDPLLCPRGQT